MKLFSREFYGFATIAFAFTAMGYITALTSKVTWADVVATFVVAFVFFALWVAKDIKDDTKK